LEYYLSLTYVPTEFKLNKWTNILSCINFFAKTFGTLKYKSLIFLLLKERNKRRIIEDKASESSKIVENSGEVCNYLEEPWKLLISKCKIKQTFGYKCWKNSMKQTKFPKNSWNTKESLV
jgi:hypothetical protein